MIPKIVQTLDSFLLLEHFSQSILPFSQVAWKGEERKDCQSKNGDQRID